MRNQRTLSLMGKGDIKIKKHKATEEEVSFDPRLSQDKKTFVLVIESTTPMSWFDAIQAALVYAKDELGRLTDGGGDSPRTH